MKIVFTTLFLMITFRGFAQEFTYRAKPIIDTTAVKNWERLDRGGISNDGRFVWYIVRKLKLAKNSLVVCDLEAGTSMRYTDVSFCEFSQNSQYVFFIKNSDSLAVVTLKNMAIRYTRQVKSYRLFKNEGTEYLAYLVGDHLPDLIIQNLDNNGVNTFSKVNDFFLAPNGNAILLKRESQDKQRSEATVEWFHYKAGIWKRSNQMVFNDSAQKLSNFQFNNSGTRLAYIKDVSLGAQTYRSICLLSEGSQTPQELVSDLDSTKLGKLKIAANTPLKFRFDHSALFISLYEPERPLPAVNMAKVDIWSYHDAILQSQQLAELASGSGRGSNKTYLAVLKIREREVIRLEQNYETASIYEGINDRWAVIKKLRGVIDERNWNPDGKAVYYLMSTTTGERTLLRMPPMALSPNGTFLICKDQVNQDYFSYNLQSGEWKNLTQSLPIPQWDTLYDVISANKSRGLSGIARWMPEDSAMWVYDSYDIWKINLKSNEVAFCITGGYGRQHHIAFSLLEEEAQVSASQGLLYLSAFDKETKKNGFYKIYPFLGEDPQLITMSDDLYSVKFCQANFQSKFPVHKSKDADIYLVCKENAHNSPNYFVTKDLKTFKAVSRSFPEKGYKWLQTELLQTQTPDSKSLQMIVYKPDDFNPAQKYPVIFHYYEKVTDQINEFKEPELSGGSINIPWFVSRDYIVCTPDIYYREGQTGENALNAVVSAANYLKKLPWADSSHFGLQGHSFGGYETNYIVTHTSMFACAMAAAGVVDMVSSYGSINDRDGKSKQWFYELHQYRMGKTPWDNPQAYLRNSPILSVNQVTSPILLMYNKGDMAVPFVQGTEFFTSLRRLNKKAWMLQYDGEGHNLIKDINRLDFTIRMEQFFNHYLKGGIMPVWMRDGIPAGYKGEISGFD